MSALVPSSGRRPGLWPRWRRLLRLAALCLLILQGLCLVLLHRARRRPLHPRVRGVARRWLQRLARTLRLEFQVTGQPWPGPRFVVANHVSWLDIPVLAALDDVLFLSKAEVARWPLVGPLAQAGGTLFIQRGNGDSGRRMAELTALLEQGHSVLVFPEGTTTDGRQVRRFFRPLFQCALQSGAPVQAVALRYPDAEGRPDRELAYVDDDSLPQSLWRILLRDRIRVQVHFCAPLEPDGHSSEQLARSTREQVVEALGLQDAPTVGDSRSPRLAWSASHPSRLEPVHDESE